MRDNRELIALIKENSKAIFEHYLDVELRGRETSVHCPFHGADNRPSMGVNYQKGMFNCLACGASGDVITFVQRFESVSFPFALDMCCDIAGLDRGYGKSADPEVKRRAEQRHEEAELLNALRAWHSTTAMQKAAKAHSLELELKSQLQRLSLVTDEQRSTRRALVGVMEQYANSLRCELAHTDRVFEAFQAASNDLFWMSRLFCEEYGLEYQPTTVRSMAEAVEKLWVEAGDRPIDPKMDGLLALSVLRQLDNAVLMENLGRGWYTDVFMAAESRSDEREAFGAGLFDDPGEDRAPESGGGALESPRMGNRALAQAAYEAAHRCDGLYTEVTKNFERHLKEKYGEVDAG